MALNVNGFYPGELKPTITLGGCIDIFENVWPNPQNTISLIEKECSNSTDTGAYWTRAETFGDGARQRIRTNQSLPVSYLADVSNNGLLQNVHNQFNMLLLAASVPYAEKHRIFESLWHEPYSMLKYSGGQEYKSHYDGGTDSGRAISALVYLNDDYQGGELEFPNFDLKIKPKAGMLILFPSNFAYRHIAHPVNDGTKYALVTWINDRQMG